MHSSLLCLLTLTILLYVNCFSFFWLVFCVLYFFVCLLCISVYVYTYIVVVFGILMEFVLYATVIAGTTKHQHNVFLIVRACDDPATSSSSFVPELLYCFYLRQRIASGWIAAVDSANSSSTANAIITNSNSLLLLTSRWLFDQTDTENKNKRISLHKQQEQHIALINHTNTTTAAQARKLQYLHRC
jgi:hypothetical protein